MYIRKKITSFTNAYGKMYPDLKVSENETLVDNMTFVITQNCNLRCTYCYEHNKNCNSVMSWDVAKRTVDMLFEEDKKHGYIGGNENSAMLLEFIGGEPLLEVDLIDKILSYFRWKAISENHRWAVQHMIAISTNGINYETEKVQKFIEKYKERLSISISIDGNKELHDACRVFPDGTGSYDIVESAYKLYLKQSDFKATKLTLAPANVGHLYTACAHLHNLGLKDIFANCVYEKGWEVEHAKILYQQMKQLADYYLDDKKYELYSNSLFDETIGKPMLENDNQNWCGGTGKMMAVDNNGYIYPCLRYIPFCLKEGCEPIIIGDIYNGIEATCDQKDTVACLKCITRKSQSTDECFNCPIARGCAWCSAYNYEETGSVNKRVTYICIMHKARVLANYYYWNSIFKMEGIEDRIPITISKEWALEIISEEEFNILLNL